MAVRLDRNGILEVLSSSGMSSALVDAAQSIAAGVHETASNGDTIPVKVHAYHTGMTAASAVTMAHPAGLAKEAKYGSLARAAAGAGLKVSAR